MKTNESDSPLKTTAPDSSGRRPVTRNDIVKALTKCLRPLPYVNAFWEGGAIAFDRLDQWSDLDLYALVDEGKTGEVFRAVEKTLRRFSPIGQTYVVTEGFEGVKQRFYRLKRASEFAVVDLALLGPSAPEKFLTPEVHGKNVFYFGKGRILKVEPFDKKAFDRKVKQRAHRLEARLSMFNNHVIKELRRGNSLEALENYRSMTLATLAEALRIKHNPIHYDFRMRYVHAELPRGVVRRLERLSYVCGPDELEKKYDEATAWCRETLESLAEESS